MIYCSALRIFSQIYVTFSGCWFSDLVALSCCAGAEYLEYKGWRHMCKMAMEHFTNPSLSVVVAKCWFLGSVVCDRTHRLRMCVPLSC